MIDASPWARDDADAIGRALAVDGGHLFLGEGGFTLAYQRGTTLSGYDVESVKAACIAAGLPVIDSRRLGFETALHLAIHTPMIAVGEPADVQPWHGLAQAPLHHVAALVSQYSVAAVGRRGCCGGDPACGSGPRAWGRDWDPPQLLPPG